MAVDLTALASLSTAATSLSSLILATPNVVKGYQPQNPFNPDGSISTLKPPPTFIFNYEGENKVTLDNEITDHYIEGNTALQDHIAQKPEIISTNGFIAELNDIAPAVLQPLKSAADRLTTISGYLPGLSLSAQIAYNEAAFLYANAQNAANAATALWSSIGGGSNQNQTKQQIAFQAWYGYRQANTLFTVQTPWGIFSDCAIQNITTVQDDTTQVVTEFSVIFKKMRFSTTQALTSANILEGRAAAQAGQNVNLGTSTPVPATTSFAQSLAGAK